MKAAHTGVATRRQGLSYIWVTWLAKLLGGNRCVWSAWFKAHFKYEKFEEQAADLERWNKNHDRLMLAKRRQLERDGWTVYVEGDNEFQLKGQTAIVAGKADLIAVKDDHILVVDGKTGRKRDADMWQVLIYLYALPKSRPELTNGRSIEGEVHYADDDISIVPDQLTDARRSQLFTLIQAVASDTPPAKHPSRDECKRCNIGVRDCPQRISARQPAAVGDF